MPVTVDGVVYSNVTWGTMTPVSATLFHSSGIAVVPLEKLPTELQKQFNYDPERAAAFRIAEAQAEAAAKLDQPSTAKALEEAIKPRVVWTIAETVMETESFGDELNWDKVESIRTRYKQLLDLSRNGHSDYQAAIRLFAEACKRAIEVHYERKKERPEYRGALKAQPKGGGGDLRQNIQNAEIVKLKTAAEAYYRNRDALAEQARKAWAEGMTRKEAADNKGQPPPPKPKPKPGNTDPYLVETP